MKMRDLITLFLFGLIFVAVITLFIQLLPLLIIAIIVMMVVRYFKTNKQIDSTNTNYEDMDSYDKLNVEKENRMIAATKSIASGIIGFVLTNLLVHFLFFYTVLYLFLVPCRPIQM